MPESRLGVRRLFYRVGQGKAEKRDAFGITFILQDFPRKNVARFCIRDLL